MNIDLIPDGPLDAPATLARYHLWGEDPANRVAHDAFYRVLRLERRLVPYEVRWHGPVDDARLTVRTARAQSARVRAEIVREVRCIFGLDFDLPAFYRLAKSDPVLAELIEPLYGLRPTLAPTALEMLVGAITAQQVNLTFAFALRARLIRRYGIAVTIAGQTVFAFPDAQTLARAPQRALRAMQFSGPKASYIRGVAQAIASGTLNMETLASATDAEVIERLTAIRGLGRWSADWFLARCLGRGSVCPAGDLAVGKVFQQYYGRGRPLSDAAIRRRARAWGACQNLAIHYLLAGMRRQRAAAGDGG